MKDKSIIVGLILLGVLYFIFGKISESLKYIEEGVAEIKGRDKDKGEIK